MNKREWNYTKEQTREFLNQSIQKAKDSNKNDAYTSIEALVILEVLQELEKEGYTCSVNKFPLMGEIPLTDYVFNNQPNNDVCRISWNK